MNCMRCGAEMTNTTGGNYICSKCGMGVNDLVYRPQNCDMPMPGDFSLQHGWVCPKCGRVLAPWKSECDCYCNTINKNNITTFLNNTIINKKDNKYEAQINE